MKEVLRTNNPVRLSYAESLLSSAGITAVTLDDGMAGLHGGAVPFIQRRIMVPDEDVDAARRLLDENLQDDE